ncbi:MAG: DEAD/DEAH box helicase family protein [Solirubrobacterales bacterium]|nr:DEAD/DEAH box helicase family protein [Solirubrobacterales bacterium]HMT04553.1 DEAD/DEAH box helicase family protein [Solirubrobacterales bacterium]
MTDAQRQAEPTPAPGRNIPDWPADRPLRAWQKQALGELAAHPGDSFLASATPAAGKTTFGLRVAWEMLASGRVSRVVVVAPTTHICRQWAADAARYGIDLEPNRPNSDGPETPDFHGVTVTYQTVAAGPGLHADAARRPTLVIADEPHHMGDQASWGVSARRAFDRASFRLLLSGTPFRSDNDAIPWVVYDDEGISRADFTYGYPEALVDRVCRPITFLPYDGEMEWESDGRVWTADFDLVLPAAETARRLRTALAADGEWMGEVLRDADARLSEVRAAGHENAGGLVVASDQEHARAIAGRLGSITGEQPEIVMSDEPGASARIAAFAVSDQRWLVSVLMVSEGVDIPRLRVGVYATAARTELFFRQVVGRFIRTTPSPRRQMSYLLLPADGRLKQLAFEIEKERRHAIELGPELEGELEELDHEPPERGEPGQAFTALSSSAAELDDAILAQTTMQLFATDDLDQSPAPMKTLSSSPAKKPELKTLAPREDSAYAIRERLREERKELVADVSRKTGESYQQINARINRELGVASVSKAARADLERGNALLERDLRS